MASPPDPTVLDRPWVASYPPGVPPTYRLPSVRLPRLLDDAARDFPAHTGLVVGRTELTFEQLSHNVERLDSALAHQGIDVGDRVLVMLPTGVSLFIVLVALWRRGAAVVPLPDDAAPEQAAEVARDAEVVAALGTPDAVAALVRETRAPWLAIVVRGDEWEAPGRSPWRLDRGLRRPRFPRRRPGRRASPAVDAGEAPADPSEPRVVTTDLTDLFREAARVADDPAVIGVGPAGRALEQPPGSPARAPVDGPALIAVDLRPDGVSAVEHSHRTLLATAFQSRLWVPDIQAARERILVAEPLHDIVGLAIGFLAALLSGATTILLDEPSPAELARGIERHQPTILVARSRRVACLLEDGDAAKRDLTSLRVALAVGEGLAPPIARELEARSGGARFRTIDGCGDAAPFTHGQPVYGRVVPTAVGLPVTDTLAVVVDPDDLSRPCAPGRAGRLLVRGPQVPDVGPAYGQGRTVDGWLVTEQLARVDDGGWFTLIGRVDEVLSRGHDPVPAARLVRALRQRGDVRDAAVVLVDGVVVAAVVSDRRRPPHPTDLLSHLAAAFDARALPDRVLLVTELPRAAGDEVDVVTLAERLRELLSGPDPAASRDPDDGRTRR